MLHLIGICTLSHVFYLIETTGQSLQTTESPDQFVSGAASSLLVDIPENNHQAMERLVHHLLLLKMLNVF